MSDQRYPVEAYRFPLAAFSGHTDEGSSSRPAGSSSPSSQGELFMVGFVIVNIVGLRFYSGSINGREALNLVREPLNVYDSKAIRVLNNISAQVGHLDRWAAQVLAPLIDSGVITAQGVVPMSRQGNHYKIPCQVHIYARISSFESVKSAILNGGFDLIPENDPSLALPESASVKEQVNAGDRKSTDEIFKLLDEKIGKKEDMGTLEPPHSVIKSELLSHQKEGLWWLVQQEFANDLPPFWEEKEGSFLNELTNYCTDKRPDPIRGGIFADDMGLGKTLTLLSLIAFDKCGSFITVEGATVEQCDVLKQREDLFVDSVCKSPKRGRDSSKTNNCGKKLKSEDTQSQEMKGKSICRFDMVSGSSSMKTTLVVCPPAVFSVWITQLEEHTRLGSLKVYLYYGRQRTADASVLKKHDIVLTTYNILANEDPLLESPMKKIEWWRVILDEAHVIKNVKAQQTRAVLNLKATRRWVVTGTPIQNQSFDLYSLMAFLRVEPLSIKSYWNSLIQSPLSRGDEQGISRLQVLMAAMSLRRTKDKTLVGLPSKTIESFYVQLSEEERQIYYLMELKVRTVVNDYISEEGQLSKYWTALGALVRLRQICADLALCAGQLRDLIPARKIRDAHDNPELLGKLLMALQEDDGIDCPICISPPKITVITSCGHIFCKMCILKTLQNGQPSCPMCRRPLTESDLFFGPSETCESARDGYSPSSKVTSLIKLLCAVREESPTTKSVVFSQFRRMLLLLEEPLKEAGFKIQRLDGTMSASKRAEVIKEFSVPAPDGPTILLASLKASGAGINLTMASRVYFFEPWWNPAMEEQAMDRVHRIGQTEEVKIVRLIAQNTIEERILLLQKKKKLFAREVLRRKGSQDRRDISVADLRYLMNL